MSGFSFKNTELGGVLISCFYADDQRGEFTKSFEKDCYCNAGIDFTLNETFVSRSMRNVIRGLHFQLDTPQSKIVSVVNGGVWDVIVDLRKGSPHFGKWEAFELNSENHLSLYIPCGFGHGFISMSDNTLMLYQCEGKYNPSTDTGIRIDDCEISIKWPIDINDAILSERDHLFGSFEDYCALSNCFRY